MRRLLLVNLLLLLSLASQTLGQSTPPCQCPEFAVDSIYLGGTAAAGETIEFSIVSSDGTLANRRFEWTTSLGEIVFGQGTSRIKVQTSKDLLSHLPAGERYPIIHLKVGARLVDQPTCKCEPVSMSIAIGRKAAMVNRFANVTGLKLSADRIFLPCRAGQRWQEGTTISPTQLIGLETTAQDPEDDVLTYSYTVNAGVIKGTGSKVKWDLSGVPPGKYAITAGVDDGCGLCGKTWTEDVVVSACEPARSLIECPSISIAGPDLPAEESFFTAKVSGGTMPSVTYEWEVTNGELLEGQGGPSIKVKLRTQGTGFVRVTIGGAEAGGCINWEEKEFVNGVLKP